MLVPADNTALSSLSGLCRMEWWAARYVTCCGLLRADFASHRLRAGKKNGEMKKDLKKSLIWSPGKKGGNLIQEFLMVVFDAKFA
jgi:hypothetical protein